MCATGASNIKLRSYRVSDLTIRLNRGTCRVRRYLRVVHYIATCQSYIGTISIITSPLFMYGFGGKGGTSSCRSFIGYYRRVLTLITTHCQVLLF